MTKMLQLDIVIPKLRPFRTKETHIAFMGVSATFRQYEATTFGYFV